MASRLASSSAYRRYKRRYGDRVWPDRALIAVAAVVILGTIGINLSSTFNTVANNLLLKGSIGAPGALVLARLGLLLRLD